jgi:hypothetical protein
MNNRLTLEWRELENENSELHLISDELEINCTELVREHYYFEDDEEVSFDRANTSILNLTMNGKRYIQLFDGSNYTIIDETGKIIFDHLEYLEFNHDSTYFTSRNSNSEEYHLYSLSNSEPEFTSEFEINYDSVFDIFHIENEFGNPEVIYQGDIYSFEPVLTGLAPVLNNDYSEIILTPVHDTKEDSILLISSNNQLPKEYFLEKYSTITSPYHEWIIINQFGEQFELIFGDGNCIRFEKNLLVTNFSLHRGELIFVIHNSVNNEQFLIVDEFEKLLENEIYLINDDIISNPNFPFLFASDYFIFENNVIGNFLIILNESKRSDYQFARIYWDAKNIWDFEVPIEQTKDPLLCLQYALIEQSNLRNIST